MTSVGVASSFERGSLGAGGTCIGAIAASMYLAWGCGYLTAHADLLGRLRGRIPCRSFSIFLSFAMTCSTE